MTGIAERADSRPRRRARLGSGSWSAIDQALNSATNFAVNIIAIHSLSVRDLGSFAIAFTLYTLGWGVSRAFASEPFIVRWSDRSDDEWRRGSGDSLAAAAAVGVVAGLIGLAAAPFLPATGARVLGQLGYAWPYGPDGNGGPPLLDELGWGIHAGEPGRLGAAKPLFPRLDVETGES